MGAWLPQRFIPALKDYSDMGGASGAAGEGKADEGIANFIKTTLCHVVLLLLACADKKKGWRFWVCWFCEGVLELH